MNASLTPAVMAALVMMASTHTIVHVFWDTRAKRDPTKPETVNSVSAWEKRGRMKESGVSYDMAVNTHFCREKTCTKFPDYHL